VSYISYHETECYKDTLRPFLLERDIPNLQVRKTRHLVYFFLSSANNCKMLGLASALCSVLYAASALAAPSPLLDDTTGLEFTSSTGSLPLLKLPYGTWRATSYDSVNDVVSLISLLVRLC
jgi:hypothetical protein